MFVRTSLLIAVLAATGCKTEDATPAAASNEAPASPTPTEQGRPHRSGKIDLPPIRQRPAPPPSLDQGEAAAPTPDDADARREERRERREERREARRAMIDTDGDGKVSPEEMTAARKQRIDDMRTRLDTDGDGKLSIAELSESRIARRMDDPSQLDVDKDGNISADELKASMDQLRERMKDRGGWRRGGGNRGLGGEGDGRGSSTP